MTKLLLFSGKITTLLHIARVLCPYSSIGMLCRAFSNRSPGQKLVTTENSDNSLGEPWTSPLADNTDK